MDDNVKQEQKCEKTKNCSHSPSLMGVYFYFLPENADSIQILQVFSPVPHETDLSFHC